MATTNNLSWYRGETITLLFTMSPVESIAGWTLVLTQRVNANDAAVVLTVNGTIVSAPAGTFTFAFTHAQTAVMSGTYAYDVQRTDVGSEAVLSIGTITILQEVLYP